MEKRIAPSEQKAQALHALLEGQMEGQNGEELLSLLVRLSTERILQEALEHEQAATLGRGRYEVRGERSGYRNGYENGTLKTAEGVLRVYEPLRRWGNKTGVLCVWAICEDGRKVLLSLSTTNSESYESCLEILRELARRGMQPPVTITTDGAPGLTKAVDTMWPKSLRIRCWFHKMQNLQQKVPAQAWPEFKALVVDMRDAPTVAAASLNPLFVPQRHQQYVRTSN